MCSLNIPGPEIFVSAIERPNDFRAASLLFVGLGQMSVGYRDGSGGGSVSQQHWKGCGLS